MLFCNPPMLWRLRLARHTRNVAQQTRWANDLRPFRRFLTFRRAGMIGGMDETTNVPPDRKVQGDSPLAKACFYVIEAIRFVADNTDKEFAGKIVAVVIACGYLVAVVVHEMAVTPVVSLAIVLLVPLGLIWFPEELGSFTGYVSRGSTIDNETPPFLVSFLGWLFLVLIGIPVVAISLGYQ